MFFMALKVRVPVASRLCVDAGGMAAICGQRCCGCDWPRRQCAYCLIKAGALPERVGVELHHAVEMTERALAREARAAGKVELDDVRAHGKRRRERGAARAVDRS